MSNVPVPKYAVNSTAVVNALWSEAYGHKVAITKQGEVWITTKNGKRVFDRHSYIVSYGGRMRYFVEDELATEA